MCAAEACKHYNVSAETLRVWADGGKIVAVKTAGGHRRYELPKKPDRKRYVYARVSSRKQEGDLERQVGYLVRKYPHHEVIRDIGSGLNFKRKGFRSILEQLFEGAIEEVVISSSDRFSRFGTREFFGWLFEHFGATLTILNNTHYKDPDAELSADILEIITVFSAKFHGRRHYQQEDQDLSDGSTEEAV